LGAVAAIQWLGLFVNTSFAGDASPAILPKLCSVVFSFFSGTGHSVAVFVKTFLVE
jgi:hypothetical protein